MLFVACRWARRSGRERVLELVRSMELGTVLGRESNVSVTQAVRSRIQRTEPARELITSTLY